MASLRTLIVDDSDAMRHVLRSVLNGYHGVEVVGEATNGEEALQQVQTLAPDLIIMDVCMPALDGTERRRMRQEKSPGNRHLDVLSSSHSGLRRKRKKNGVGWVCLQRRRWASASQRRGRGHRPSHLFPALKSSLIAFNETYTKRRFAA